MIAVRERIGGGTMETSKLQPLVTASYSKAIPPQPPRQHTNWGPDEQMTESVEDSTLTQTTTLASKYLYILRC